MARSRASQAGGRLLLGALAGTVAMTAAMRAMRGRLPAPERYPLPPREIIEGPVPERALECAGEALRAPPSPVSACTRYVPGRRRPDDSAVPARRGPFESAMG